MFRTILAILHLSMRGGLKGLRTVESDTLIYFSLLLECGGGFCIKYLIYQFF